MPRKFFKRIIPHPDWMKSKRTLRRLGHMLDHPDLWHLHRHSVAGAVFLGGFAAMLPIPLQMVLAVFLAFWFKKNVAICVAMVWVTNPLTIGPVFYFNYWLGTLLIGTPEAAFPTTLSADDLTQWVSQHYDELGLALILGSVISGLCFGALGYISIQLFWISSVRRNWKKRIKQRTSKANQATSDSNDSAPSDNS